MYNTCDNIVDDFVIIEPSIKDECDAFLNDDNFIIIEDYFESPNDIAVYDILKDIRSITSTDYDSGI